MICQCCSGTRSVCETELPGEPESLCFRCWKWYMLLFTHQPFASDKWVRDSEEG